jgi:hypothetical protein
MMLDAKKIYGCRTTDECHWRFKYESINTMEGIRSEWRAHRRRPGVTAWAPQGSYPEMEILQRLDDNNKPLTDDDRLDLMVFLYGDKGKHWNDYMDNVLANLRAAKTKEYQDNE